MADDELRLLTDENQRRIESLARQGVPVGRLDVGQMRLELALTMCVQMLGGDAALDALDLAVQQQLGQELRAAEGALRAGAQPRLVLP